MSENQHVIVSIRYGDEVHLQSTSTTTVMRANIAAVSRFLMDQLYVKLDDQVDAVKLRAHRRRMRLKRRRAAGENHTNQE